MASDERAYREVYWQCRGDFNCPAMHDGSTPEENALAGCPNCLRRAIGDDGEAVLLVMRPN